MTNNLLLCSLQISGRVESAPADSDHGLPTVKGWNMTCTYCIILYVRPCFPHHPCYLSLPLPDIPTIPAEVMPTPEELIVEISKMEETIKLVSTLVMCVLPTAQLIIVFSPITVCTVHIVWCTVHLSIATCQKIVLNK